MSHGCRERLKFRWLLPKWQKCGKYDAVICLGAVIRGSTSHYDYVCNEVSKGIAAVSLESGIPVLFGVLTTENIEQAIERAGTKAGNKGYDCAVSAIEMVNLIREIGCRVTVTQEPSMIVIRVNTPDQVLEQTILSLLQQAQIDAEQITFCAEKKIWNCRDW